MTRYRLDPSTRRPVGTDLLIGGSPLRLFRLTPAGARRFAAIAAGDDVDGATEGGLLARLVDGGAAHPVPTMATGRLADTTVVIPTHAPDPARLRALVNSVGAAASVIVVDDASPVRVTGVDANVIRLDTNRGPAISRNTGVGATTSRYVAFLDDDVTVVDPAWLPRVLGHFDDDAVAAVAPRVRSRPGRGALAEFERDHSPLDLGDVPGTAAPGRRIGYLPAAALVVRRDAFESVGGFDPSLRFGEDVDLVWRLVAAGHRCRYEPIAEVEHAPRPTWAAWARQRFDYGTSAAPLAARHRGALAPVRTTGWSAAIWMLITVKRPMAAACVAGYTTVALARKVHGLTLHEATRLTRLGHLHAGRLFGAAVRRAWWPILTLGATRWRWCRRVLALCLVASIADRWRGDPRAIGLGLADDACYSAGLWRGVIAERQPGPLLPELNSWPGTASDR